MSKEVMMDNIDQWNALLMNIIGQIQAKHTPAFEKWQETVGIDTEPWAEDWKERLTDPRNQQMESYMKGLRDAQQIALNMLVKPEDDK